MGFRSSQEIARLSRVCSIILGGNPHRSTGNYATRPRRGRGRSTSHSRVRRSTRSRAETASAAPARSGLSVDNLYRKEGPVNFTIPTYSKTETAYADAFDVGQKCVSGCANVLVTVVDPATGDPVSGATVDATLGSLGAAKSVSGGLAGDQFLCVQSDDPSASSCGTSLSGLSTDSAGEPVRFTFCIGRRGRPRPRRAAFRSPRISARRPVRRVSSRVRRRPA